MDTVEQRQWYVAWAVAMTHGTTLEPDAYELLLLQEYVEGIYTLEQVLDLLKQRTLLPA